MPPLHRLLILLPPPPSARASNPSTSSTRERSDTTTTSAIDRSALYAAPPMPPPSPERTITGEPGPAYWQNRADYQIDAALDEKSRTITASATIIYRNNSPHTLDQVYLNLEQNLFRPGSRGERLTRPSARFGNRDFFAGGMTITSTSINGAPVTLAVEDTIGRIDLPAPLTPGGSVSIAIAWSFPIPPYGSDRLGIEQTKAGDTFQVAQWFPSICVFDDVRGWNTLPYLGQGEFYTNFGDFDVRLTVPRSHIVAATGTLTNEREVFTAQQCERLSTARSTENTTTIIGPDEVGTPASRPASTSNTLTWVYHAENVRTFAWASSPAFILDACTAPGVGSSSGGTLCMSYYPREADLWRPEASGGGATQMLRASIDHYSKKWYPYPYPTASNVSGIVGGMEYPMIIFCSAREGGDKALWGVTTHEIGHTWFPMILNTNERMHAWMDEGFNTFINFYASLERYPNDLPRRGNPRRFARDYSEPFHQIVDTPADLIIPGTLGDLQYAKPAAGLTLLREGILGPDRFDPAFRTYLQRWAFKSPTPADFFRTMEDETGEDLGWFFRGWFYSTQTLDQGVTGVLQPEGDGKNARVTLFNRGLIMPLVYTVEYEDKTSETRTLPVQAWAVSETYVATWNTGGKRIHSVTVDPNEDFPDVNPRNNVWSR